MTIYDIILYYLLMPYNILQPGSLDLDDVDLNIGGLIDCSAEAMDEGRKYVLIEDGLDRFGFPLQEIQNGMRKRSYTLLMGPDSPEKGRHRSIPR